LLLHKLTEAFGTPEQLRDYLQDPNLGPESSVAKGEWKLWRLRLKSLEESQKWVELFDITSTLLKRARTKDSSSQLVDSKLSDWIVWEGFLLSATMLHDYRYFSIKNCSFQELTFIR
jgi:N-terminal acetyltransferase B complex non-catalytic subunit